MYDSMQQMASALDIPLHHLKWAKREGCRFVIHGRCHVGEFIKWWFSRDVSQDGDDVNEDWGKRDKRAGALLKEVKLDEEKSRVIDFGKASRFIRFLQGQVFFGELERLQAEFPAALKGLDERAIESEVAAQIKRVKQQLEGEVKSWVERKGKEQ